MNMRRRTALIIAAAAVAGIGLGIWMVRHSQSAVQYRTVTTQHSDINITISATGNPNPVVTVQVGSLVSGIILALNADFNTKVTKGQLVARIDPAPFQAKVDQAQAHVDTAKAAVVNAEAGVQKAQAAIQATNATLDTTDYPIGVKVSKQDLAQLSIKKKRVLPKWNYTISPKM